MGPRRYAFIHALRPGTVAPPAASSPHGSQQAQLPALAPEPLAPQLGTCLSPLGWPTASARLLLGDNKSSWDGETEARLGTGTHERPARCWCGGSALALGSQPPWMGLSPLPSPAAPCGPWALEPGPAREPRAGSGPDPPLHPQLPAAALASADLSRCRCSYPQPWLPPSTTGSRAGGSQDPRRPLVSLQPGPGHPLPTSPLRLLISTRASPRSLAN